jgi:very-short-patch-repair endonuclease
MSDYDRQKCNMCGKPRWWHGQAHHVRSDDGHAFNSPYTAIRTYPPESKSRLDFADKLRAQSTRYEKMLWKRLKKGCMGHNVEQQIVIAGYILDFYCHDAGIGIELDGKQHDVHRDSIRDQRILHRGITVMRFPNPRSYEEVNAILWKVGAEIRYRIGRFRAGLSTNPRRSSQGQS